MRIDRRLIDPNLTQDQVDEIINALIVNVDEFSEIACIYGQAYGVTVFCDDCGIELNNCIREELIRVLISAQQTAEKIIGYSLVDSYHVYEETWDGSARIQLDKPGIEAVNMRRQFTALEDFGPFAISPYIQEDITIGNHSDQFCYAEVSDSLVRNPGNIVIRDETGSVIPTQQVNGWPKKVAGNWRIPLDKKVLPPCSTGLTYNAQHCDYMIVETDALPTCTGGEIVPVYPNSNQIIPMAKDPEAILGGWRFWFHPWVLLDDAFADDGADLQNGEFYKLLQEIEFKCVTEVECDPVITFEKASTTDCNKTEFVPGTGDITINLIDAEAGIIHIQSDDLKCGSCFQTLLCCTCKAPRKIRVCYKTSPDVIDYHADITNIKSAIAHLAAADLPLESCNCPINQGFIKKAQSSYNQVRINPITGETIINPQFGQVYGHLVFQERISRVRRKYKSFQA